MDITGAKALKKRLGLDEADEVSPAVRPADVPEDAPPVYHWTGKTPPKRDPAEEDDSLPRSASLFSRVSLGFR